jgi:hypothetical protein
MELSLYRFPDDSVHLCRLLGQNTGVVQLDTMWNEMSLNTILVTSLFPTTSIQTLKSPPSLLSN